MAIYKYPRILKDDYNGFRQIVPELPETFEKWEFDLQRRENTDQGSDAHFKSIDVPVNGGTFIEFCNQRNEPYTITALYRFASESKD